MTVDLNPLDLPITREKVEALARSWADNPASVAEIVHEGFNADRETGGFAFQCDQGMVVYARDGGVMWSVDPGSEEACAEKVECFWEHTRHVNRQLTPGELNQCHRAAIEALVAACESVGDLPPELRAGVTDIAVADEVFVRIRRSSKEPTEEAALRVLAANDFLLGLPDEYTRAHPCPSCGRPAVGRPEGFYCFCDDCSQQAVCSHQRPVSGHNTHWWGGFQAFHRDDDSVCDQVTKDNKVTVNGIKSTLDEAKFGGVFLGVKPSRYRRLQRM